MFQNTPTAVPERGCGKRKAGGIYAVCKLGPGGMPLEAFLIDSPSVELAALALARGLTPRGVRLIDVALGEVPTWHVFDQIGRDTYPHVADYVEEVGVLGMSRRLPRTLDFSKLSAGSKIILLHPHAHIENAAEYYAAIGRSFHSTKGFAWWCPRLNEPHEWSLPAEPPAVMCAGLWWHDLAQGQADLGRRQQRAGLRGDPADIALTPWKHTLPSSTTTGWQRPTHITPSYRLAAFMWLPITSLEIVRGQHGEETEALKATAGCALPREVLDE